MTHRYTLFIGLSAIFSLLQAQTVLTPGAYDALKTHGQLPDGPITILGEGQGNSAPASWVTERGGGGACGCWIAPDGNYVSAIVENDDQSSPLLLLPFTFNLFGQSYTSLYINNNGNISFDQPYGTYTASGFPSASFVMVAPFWADVDTRDTTPDLTMDFLNGQVLFRITPTALYVNWVDVGYFAYHDSLRNSFQLTITDGTDAAIPGGNNVSFCYKDMQWTTGDASMGLFGFGGGSATVGVNKGDGIEHAQVGRFNADNDIYNGAYTDSSGVDWLDSTHFYLNTLGTGIPPIFGSTFDCDTVIVQMPVGPEVRDAALYHLIVLPGAPDELVSCTSVAPTLPNFSNINDGPADKLELEFEINSDEAVIGTHFITFTATNNDAEPLSSTYVLQVEKTGTSSGIAHNGVEAMLQLTPNPAAEQALLSWSAARQVRLIEMISADGRKVMSQRPVNSDRSFMLDLKSVAPGSYMVRASSSEGLFTTRLVKTAY